MSGSMTSDVRTNLGGWAVGPPGWDVGGELRIELDAFGNVAAGQLIRMRKQDQLVQRLHRPATFHKTTRKIVEQFRMRRRCPLPAEVVGRYDDSIAKVLLRCWLFGFVLLFVWLGAVFFMGEWIYERHAIWFGFKYFVSEIHTSFCDLHGPRLANVL